MSALPPHRPVTASLAMTPARPEPESAEVLDIARAFGLLWRHKAQLLGAILTGATLGAIWLGTMAVPTLSGNCSFDNDDTRTYNAISLQPVAGAQW